MSTTFDATGIWRGVATSGADRLAVRANLFDDEGWLSGVVFIGDPDAGELVDLGGFRSTRQGMQATMKTQTGLTATGTFGTDEFTGTLRIVADSGTLDAPLRLLRVPARRRGYRPITPTRLIDTRDARGTKIAPGRTALVPVVGKGDIPFGAEIDAVVVNITGTEATGRGYVTAWAGGDPRPFTANLYLERPGQTAGNLAIVPVSDRGTIEVFSQSGMHLVVDAMGWFPRGSILQRVTPTRGLDTRAESAVGYSGPKPGAGATVTAELAGIAGLPAAGVAAVVVNITATEATAAGYVTAWAADRPQPGTANLNIEVPDQTICNLAIVPTSATSAIKLFTQRGTHLIVDVLGWFPTERTPPSNAPGEQPPTGGLVRDGSFESSLSIARAYSYDTIDSGILGSWMVVDGSVDVVGPDGGTAADGNQFVDLNGNATASPGTIEQLVPTAPDRRYEVRFKMSGNPNGLPVVKAMEVAFGDTVRQYTFDTTGRTNADLGWVEHSFVANPDCGSATVLSFRSLTPGERGPNLDAVTVVDAGPGGSCQIGGYRALEPTRLLDTRPESAIGYSGPMPGAGATVVVPVAVRAGIPASGATAVAVNITATEAGGPGFVTAWASGTPQPTTSNLNLDAAGQTRPNHAIVPVGADGSITLFTYAPTHLVVDVFGWFSA